MRIPHFDLAHSATLAALAYYAHTTQEYLAAYLASFACGLSLCRAIYQPVLDETLTACKLILKAYEDETRRIITAQNMRDKPRP